MASSEYEDCGEYNVNTEEARSKLLTECFMQRSKNYYMPVFIVRGIFSTFRVKHKEDYTLIIQQDNGSSQYRSNLATFLSTAKRKGDNEEFDGNLNIPGVIKENKRTDLLKWI